MDTDLLNGEDEVASFGISEEGGVKGTPSGWPIHWAFDLAGFAAPSGEVEARFEILDDILF